MIDEAFKPMLAADVKGDLSKVKYPVMVSAKIDGIRAIVRGGRLLSRSLKPIPNKAIRAALERPEFEGLDGELVVGDGIDFQATTSKVMSIDGDTDGVEFWVFDVIDAPQVPFFDRCKFVAEAVAKAPRGAVVVDHVPQEMVPDEHSVLQLEAHYLAQGFEGAMLRDPSGLYKYGRATVREGGLLKLKRFEDAEATIVGFVEEMQNTNSATLDELGHTKRSSAKDGKVGKGTLGAFEVRLLTNPEVRFNVGSGFTADQRREFWQRGDDLLGRVVKFKHLPHGAKDAPRHPVFLGFRDVRDM